MCRKNKTFCFLLKIIMEIEFKNVYKNFIKLYKIFIEKV